MKDRTNGRGQDMLTMYDLDCSVQLVSAAGEMLVELEPPNHPQKILVLVLSIYSVSFLFCGVTLTVHAQSDLQTTKYRKMVIDLGNGLKTNARLNLPSNGDGPFPAVLLVPGSGPNDLG
jgi:hypothetical protein